MRSALVADTHAAIWFLARNPSLSRVAWAALNQTAEAGEPIYIPTICVVEAIIVTIEQIKNKRYSEIKLPEMAMRSVNGFYSFCSPLRTYLRHFRNTEEADRHPTQVFE